MNVKRVVYWHANERILPSRSQQRQAVWHHHLEFIDRFEIFVRSVLGWKEQFKSAR